MTSVMCCNLILQEYIGGTPESSLGCVLIVKGHSSLTTSDEVCAGDFACYRGKDL